MTPETINAPAKGDLFLARLRSQTAPAHERLEAVPISKSVISPDLTLSQYASYLGLMHTVIKSTEELFFPMLSNVIPDLEERRKTDCIERDLLSCGEPIPAQKHVFSPDYSEAFALGILYTVEGSTLGGRYIIKNVSETLGFDEGNGARYFAGYGNRSGAMWKNFLNELTRFEQQTGEGDAIIAGASFAFETIHQHFIDHA